MGGVELQVDLVVDGGHGLRVLVVVLVHLREDTSSRRVAKERRWRGFAVLDRWPGVGAVLGRREEVTEGWV